MYSFDFHDAGSDGLSEFVARGLAAHRGSEFVVTGKVERDDAGRPIYVLWLRFVPSHYENYNVYFRGSLHLDGSVFAGIWGMVKDDMPFPFEFRRISPELLVCRPRPDYFRTNKAAARWAFALRAVHTHVLRKLSSTRLLDQRRFQRSQWQGFLAKKATVDVSELYRTTTYADSCFYFAILLHQSVVQAYVTPSLSVHGLTHVVNHSWVCDHCEERITGARLLCLECGINDTVDCCDKPECMSAVVHVKTLPKPHLPSHDVVKLRSIVLTRETGRVLNTSKAALSKARGLLDCAEPSIFPSPSALHSFAFAPDIFRLASNRGSVTAGRPAMTTCPSCISCLKPTHYPCWFCCDCEGSSLEHICQHVQRLIVTARGRIHLYIL